MSLIRGYLKTKKNLPKADFTNKNYFFLSIFSGYYTPYRGKKLHAKRHLIFIQHNLSKARKSKKPKGKDKGCCDFSLQQYIIILARALKKKRKKKRNIIPISHILHISS